MRDIYFGVVIMVLLFIIAWFMVKPVPVDEKLIREVQKSRDRIEQDSILIVNIKRANDSLGQIVSRQILSIKEMEKEIGIYKGKYEREKNRVRGLNADASINQLRSNLSR